MTLQPWPPPPASEIFCRRHALQTLYLSPTSTTDTAHSRLVATDPTFYPRPPSTRPPPMQPPDGRPCDLHELARKETRREIAARRCVTMHQELDVFWWLVVERANCAPRVRAAVSRRMSSRFCWCSLSERSPKNFTCQGGAPPPPEPALKPPPNPYKSHT